MTKKKTLTVSLNAVEYDHYQVLGAAGRADPVRLDPPKTCGPLAARSGGD